MSNQNKTTSLIAKNIVIKSLVWKLFERSGTQGIQFIIQIILARLLCPEDYGVLAILLAFIAIANVFVQSGLNTALIQKKDADNEDFSSVFWVSLVIALVLYFVIFLAAPYIAKFYHNQILLPVLRIISLTLFFGSLNSIQNAYVSKHLLFKRLFFSSTGAVIISGIVGVVLAANGFGIWSLVIQHLLNNAVISLILWLTVKWRPQFIFSVGRIKPLFSYGWKLLGSALLETGYRQLYNLVIGKVFSGVQLGYFSRGEQFPQLIATNIDGSIQSVMLPTLSAVNDNTENVKKIARKSISLSSFILIPFMFGMAAVSENMVLLLLTEKWLPCVPFIQLSCIAFSFYPIHTANLTAINALGRSDIFLKLEIIKKIVGILILFISLPFGLMWMAVGRVISSLISTIINSFPNKKLLNYSYFDQIKDTFPAFFLSFCMMVVIFIVGKIDLPLLVLFIIQILVGILFYIIMAKIFKIAIFDYLIQTLKGLQK